MVKHFAAFMMARNFAVQSLCSLMIQYYIFHRLIVSPMYFRRGIAQQLLNHVVKLYETNLVKVSTGARNVPAIQFYEKNGFRKVEDVAINERLSLTLFECEGLSNK